MLAFVDRDERVPRNHPLRVVRQFADRALRELSPVFDEMYATDGPRRAVRIRRTDCSLSAVLGTLRN
jgi:hypothetical protein